ncbi:uncharacterized protein CC84DRAFT_1142240 [Paraphaeosphaeria sporulosa]|uniref:FR47-like domain-containing protein n=1 Tax=Paraphaeosphaeria sporulosa TaxID=1460663 RepID=A0A177CNE2_9PLEO|nr:uncharacterized protein CC84DRAFT_1142240 [Paraphaeosphaeria sporulosa]OAG09055.1 hypothetical protein CC84DRAFT_1142240 [Paraphaeosphaeria sporulosa]
MQVYEHPASSPPLQAALKSTLPHSMSIFYRTKHPNRTADAHILATFPISTTDSISRCWATAYLDRSMRPETELWIFTTGEMPGHYASPDKEKQGFCTECKKAVLSLIDYMGSLPIPPIHPWNEPAIELARQHEKEHPQTGPDAAYPPGPGLYMRHLLIPTIVTLGACHQEVVQLLAEAGILCKEFPGHEAYLNKFWFKVSDLPHTRDLPEELRWGEMREQDIAIVQARTSIPRTARTLLSLKSVGVFEIATDKPVAWTFLGLDGSLTTLHTEPKWRGKGIAKAVAVKIFKEHAPGLAVDDEQNAWAHADVYVGNVQSESVCRSLGGKPSVKILWVRVDIGKGGRLGA